MHWHYRTFDQMTLTDLYALLQLRSAVFVVEQQCAYQDLDDKDQSALHLWCSDRHSRIVACCRILPPGISYPEASIGRVAVALPARGQQLGRQLMERAIKYILEEAQQTAIRISAQSYLEQFYTSLGFARTGEVYDEDGIPHIGMLLTVPEK